MPWIALFALRANGKSTDKVSRYSEIFFTIDTNGDSEAAWKEKSPLNLKSIEAFAKTNDEELNI